MLDPLRLPGEPVTWDEALFGPEPAEPSDAELLGAWPDPFSGPPDGADAWLSDLSLPELDKLARSWARQNGKDVPGSMGAGFTHNLPPRETIIDDAIGFAAGGALDVMEPDPVLAGFVADASESGLGKLSDDELIGLLCAARRLSSWQAAVELKAVAELDRRRRQTSSNCSSRAIEHVQDELSTALTLTGRSAEVLLGFSRGIARLPMVLRALSAGVIDQAKARVFVDELAAVSDLMACAIAAALWRPARRMTTGQLRAEIRALILKNDPDAIRRRREKAQEDARVEVWQEGSGNLGIAGRELPAASIITADKRISAIAAELKRAGAKGTTEQLRAAVFTALLTGQDLASLAPERVLAPERAGKGELAKVTGTLHLTMPLSSWAGWTDAPGEVAGLGPVDVDTCRDLAARLGASRGTQWCVTITDADGKAAGHACTRTAPGTGTGAGTGTAPGKDPPGVALWLKSLKIDWLERGSGTHDSCHHSRQVRSYRPGRKLGHLTKIRQRTCIFPTCRRPAESCDLDHTVPYDQGGITCECNLGATCRQHHRAKQASGWELTQTKPGYFTWTAPHGRTYTAEPDSYPV